MSASIFVVLISGGQADAARDGQCCEMVEIAGWKYYIKDKGHLLRQKSVAICAMAKTYLLGSTSNCFLL